MDFSPATLIFVGILVVAVVVFFVLRSRSKKEDTPSTTTSSTPYVPPTSSTTIPPRAPTTPITPAAPAPPSDMTLLQYLWSLGRQGELGLISQYYQPGDTPQMTVARYEAAAARPTEQHDTQASQLYTGPFDAKEVANNDKLWMYAMRTRFQAATRKDIYQAVLYGDYQSVILPLIQWIHGREAESFAKFPDRESQDAYQSKLAGVARSIMNQGSQQ